MSTRTGVWLVGALGNVATATVLGASSLRRGRVEPLGMVTRGWPDLPRVEDLVFGGHDVRRGSPVEAARTFARSNGVPAPDVVAAAEEDLTAFGARLREGVRTGDGRAGIDRVRRDLDEFRRNAECNEVIVLHVATAEPDAPAFESIEEMDRRAAELPPSALYAVAAIRSHAAYVNFTSSRGSSMPAMDALARRERVPHMGRDGKTGETLVKTALAPMFAARALKVRSWSSHNLLGNADGAALADPAVAGPKLQHKDIPLKQLLGPDVESHVRIDFVRSLDDWKTAWDLVHFEGFLGAKMSLQFTWQGCDSALAAPLILDLARLAALALRRGETGSMPHLACFFKDPYGVTDHHFFRQVDALLAYRGGAPRA